jgi:hypothetical protein
VFLALLHAHFPALLNFRRRDLQSFLSFFLGDLGCTRITVPPEAF